MIIVPRALRSTRTPPPPPPSRRCGRAADALRPRPQGRNICASENDPHDDCNDRSILQEGIISMQVMG